MSSTTYGLGGYRPQHPSQGKTEEYDDDTETVTRWDNKGDVVESRPYTAEEVAAAEEARKAAEEIDNQIDLKAEIVALREALVKKEIITREELDAEKPEKSKMGGGRT